MPLKAYLVQRMKLGIVKGKLAAWTIKRLKADNDNVTEETTTGFAGLAPEGAEDYTALAGHSGAMEEVAQGRHVDEAQVPQGTASVSVQGSAGTSVSLAAPSLGGATLNGGIIVPKCTKHALRTYYATDHLGTVRFTKTIDETGTEVATSTHDYEPFGVEITPTDACDNTHKFTGHERDTLPDGSNMDYMHFRFFSASTGRFQKPDSNFDNPGANPQGWNLYSYVKGNPVNFNDPTGHQATQVPGGPATPAPYVGPNGPGPVAKAQEHQRQVDVDRHQGKLVITIKDISKVTNGNTTTVTATRTTMTADDKGNFTKTTSTQTETQTKDPKTGKVDVSVGKQQQTTTSGQSDDVAAAVNGFSVNTVEGAGGSFKTVTAGLGNLVSASDSAQGASSSPSDMRGMMPELADATYGMGLPNASMGHPTLGQTVHNIGVVGEIVVAGGSAIAAVGAPPPANYLAAAGVVFVGNDIREGNLHFEY